MKKLMYTSVFNLSSKHSPKLLYICPNRATFIQNYNVLFVFNIVPKLTITFSLCLFIHFGEYGA